MTCAFAGALLATLVLWLDGESTRVSEPMALQYPDDSKSPASVVEPLAPTSAASRQAPEPAALRTEASILSTITRQPVPDVEVPSWSDEMEGNILSYIARYPGLELTELQVQCAVSECVIFMGGRSVPVYQMGFDVFANDNGFRSAVIQTMDGGPNRIVYLRR
jgi:hypothetical protein